MKAKLISEQEDKTYAIILDIGDEVRACLIDFAREHHLADSHITAIGAFSHAVLAYFDWEVKEYVPIPIDEQVEVLTLTGDITLNDGEPMLHAHVVVGKRDGTAHGGHLMEAHVRPTLEAILVESPEHLRRTVDPKSGLALISV
jgi:predicted DNA-binding protein with PD1-like motif